jgi:hypothetical protein
MPGRILIGGALLGSSAVLITSGELALTVFAIWLSWPVLKANRAVALKALS